ncbi:urotensin-2B [Piliocolobus tephrosceles]|uniref:Urotensin 2B n=1 Tax=Piliocolobus tephrosceles TaxID=591936 RepID=A0A8C9GSD7_9PRIM|nr:urotensin-2B [Piliocolobus tephrosceles]
MNKILSSTLCFGLLTLSSVLIFLQSVRGWPYLTQGNEILPDKNYPNREELLLALLNKNFDFQRPFNTDLALPNKLEELNQLEKLKEQLVEKDSEMSYAIDGLFSSHPSKRDKLLFQGFKIDFQKMIFAVISERKMIQLAFLSLMVVINKKVHIKKIYSDKSVTI